MTRDHPILRALARVEVASGDARAAYNERDWADVQQALAEAAEAAADAATTVARAKGVPVPLADLSPRELLLTETLDAALCELAAARRQVEDARAEADRLGDELAAAEEEREWLLPLAVDSILAADRSDDVPFELTDAQRAELRALPSWADHLSLRNYGEALTVLAAELIAGDDKPGEVIR